jgi:hypothetical protein
MGLHAKCLRERREYWQTSLLCVQTQHCEEKPKEEEPVITPKSSTSNEVNQLRQHFQVLRREMESSIQELKNMNDIKNHVVYRKEIDQLEFGPCSY